MSKRLTARIPPGGPHARFAYPEDLVRLVRERWTSPPLPDDATLLAFYAACFQASMMREEERPVTFRAILADPSLFDPAGRPPEGLQPLELESHLGFQPGELRRLSVAVDPTRTLIGVCGTAEHGLRIWGLINSGTRWLRDTNGGRLAGAPLPKGPVVGVDGPGMISAYNGDELVGKLRRGKLSGARLDAFASEWLPEMFTPFRTCLVERHEAARRQALEYADERWSKIAPELPRQIMERMHKRVISELRDAHHGGTILFVPTEDIDGIAADASIDLRYRFGAGSSRSFFPDLVVDIINRLARLFGTIEPERVDPVGWREFESTTDDTIVTLDEALFEMAHMLAGLAAVDGAVVISMNHELLGFGGMISVRIEERTTVSRAVDIEGDRRVDEQIGVVGARHRAAYRLAGAVPGSVAIVISQDGGARFVTQKQGCVTYWEQD